MPKQAAEPNYGNWVTIRIIYFFTMLGLILLTVAIPFWYLTIPSIVFFAVAGYFAYARHLFSPKGRDVQNKIWDNVVANVGWDGVGKAIDIGCGNGALTIKVAKHYPQTQVTGIDYWGERWEYSQAACEANAKTEGVANRVVFERASASKLPFEDGTFDVAVSNFCFHEVQDVKDKREVIREALRVVKKGGKFTFSDLFLLKRVYGTPEELVETIKGWGISEVEFVVTKDEPYIPAALKLPFMVGRMAIVKGIK
jgi:SAM-dependent methyltransferase